MALIACAWGRSEGIAGRPIDVGGRSVIGAEDATRADRVVWRSARALAEHRTGREAQARAGGQAAHFAWPEERCAAAFRGGCRTTGLSARVMRFCDAAELLVV